MGVTTTTTVTAFLLLLLVLLLAQVQNSITTTVKRITHTDFNNIVEIKIGSRASTLSVGFDTGTDIALLQWCNSKISSTLQSVDCRSELCSHIPNTGCRNGRNCYFKMTYGDSTVQVELMQDKLTLNGYDTIITNFTFGCVRGSSGTSFPMKKQGLLGLGRGPLSLLSQSGSRYKSIFSYCLPNLTNPYQTGQLVLGQDAGLQPGTNKHNAPLLQSPTRTSLYFLPLANITVENTFLPKNVRKYYSWTTIDSGIVFTSLVKEVYNAVATLVHQRMRGRPCFQVGKFFTCYKSKFNLTAITFKFRFFDLRLTEQQFVYKFLNSDIQCLAFVPSPPHKVNRFVNTIGSYQLQNRRVHISDDTQTGKFIRIDSDPLCNKY